MIRKRNNLTADMEKVLVVWIEDQITHNIPLSQSKAVTLSSPVKLGLLPILPLAEV